MIKGDASGSRLPSAIPPKFSAKNPCIKMEKLDRQLFEIWVSCGIFNKRNLWKTMHRQTQCWKLSWSTDGKDPHIHDLRHEYVCTHESCMSESRVPCSPVDILGYTHIHDMSHEYVFTLIFMTGLDIWTSHESIRWLDIWTSHVLNMNISITWLFHISSHRIYSWHEYTLIFVTWLVHISSHRTWHSWEWIGGQSSCPLIRSCMYDMTRSYV